MENVRKMELFSDSLRHAKLASKPFFKTSTVYSEGLCAVHLNKNVRNFNKPIYVGLTVLVISKTLMYSFHYNIMKKYYRDKIKLLYMDTGKQKKKLL